MDKPKIHGGEHTLMGEHNMHNFLFAYKPARHGAHCLASCTLNAGKKYPHDDTSARC
jgi:hypothetical protein